MARDRFPELEPLSVKLSQPPESDLSTSRSYRVRFRRAQELEPRRLPALQRVRRTKEAPAPTMATSTAKENSASTDERIIKLYSPDKTPQKPVAIVRIEKHSALQCDPE
jgi:hypothetical protein